jgi:hypothetical protein
VYDGVSGSISLETLDDQGTTWQINSDCESLLIESTVINNGNYQNYQDYLYVDDQWIIGWSGSETLFHTTNAGTISLSFLPTDRNGVPTNPAGVNIDWKCYEFDDNDGK